MFIRGKYAKCGLLVLVVVAMLGTSANGDDDCLGALVKSTYSSTSSVRSDWRLAKLVTEKDWDEASHDGGVNAVIYGIPVGASYSDFKQRVSDKYNSYSESLSTQSLLNLAWVGLDPNSPNAYQACLDAQQLGLTLNVMGATQTKIYLRIRYSGTESGNIKVTWVPAEVAGKPLDRMVPATGNGRNFEVDRPGEEIKLAANYRGIASRFVPLGPLPPPLPPEQRTTLRDLVLAGHVCYVRLTAPPGEACTPAPSGIATGSTYNVHFDRGDHKFITKGPECQAHEPNGSWSSSKGDAGAGTISIGYDSVIFAFDETGKMTGQSGEGSTVKGWTGKMTCESTF